MCFRCQQNYNILEQCLRNEIQDFSLGKKTLDNLNSKQQYSETEFSKTNFCLIFKYLLVVVKWNETNI